MGKRYLLFSVAMVIAVSLATVLPVIAQLHEGETGIEVYGSLKKLVGDNQDDDVVSPLFGVKLGYTVIPAVTLMINGGYGTTYPRDAQKSGLSKYTTKISNTPFKTTLIPILASVKLNYRPETAVNPYLSWGMGVLFWDLKNNGTSAYGTRRNGLFGVGAGVECFLNEAMGLDLGLHYQHILMQKKDMSGYGDVQTGNLEARVGLVFLFGGNRDTDGDGILNKYDKCPKLAEDKDGFQDEDGCPDLDNDGDGIPDLQDKCPNLAEDKDGYQDEDGCPDLDNDGDGIPDLRDQCPNQPETVNGFEDEDGCPDKKPEIVIQKEAPIVLEGITFRTGSAQLVPSAKLVLNKIVQTMTDYPKMVVEVSGHTDNVGNRLGNMRLSKRRAEAVKAYMVLKGIAADRIKTAGYGPDKPVAPNTDTEGRAKNRRIEFIRVD